MRQRDIFDIALVRSENLVGVRIAEARREAGLSLEGLSRRLAGFGLRISYKGLSKWELGETVPNAYQLMAVCRALGIDDMLSQTTPVLNAAGRKKLAEYKKDLIASGRYGPAGYADGKIEYIDMPVCYIAASAGTGLFLDDDSFETVSFPKSAVPAGAEFGVRVSGDSMEPAYRDGQIVWVQPCETLRPGEVGIFVYDGEGYLKVYGEREPETAEAFTDSYGVVGKQPVLISYNRKYPPRPVSPEAAFQIVGRVL